MKRLLLLPVLFLTLLSCDKEEIEPITSEVCSQSHSSDPSGLYLVSCCIAKSELLVTFEGGRITIEDYGSATINADNTFLLKRTNILIWEGEILSDTEIYLRLNSEQIRLTKK